MNDTDYDIGIVGGGLAGLTAAIQLRKKGYRVVLFEKNTYPFHRVCGEYISMESRDCLIRCGINVSSLQLPEIKKLQVSAPNGQLLKMNLYAGGFGISRFKLDHLLYEEAKKKGVIVFENAKVNDIQFVGRSYEIKTKENTCRCKLALGCFGKRSSLDINWKRDFVLNKPSALNNFIGIKYHVQTEFPRDTIALHNFKNGYCGISGIEENRYCICYLTTAANVREAGSIREMERIILYKNQYLKQLFENSDFLFTHPVSVSQISFERKKIIYNHVPLAGDACGMITPLCGNGMSMAMHAGSMFVGYADAYLQKRLALQQMLQLYEQDWKKQFSGRLRTGRWIQRNFGGEWITCLFISLMKKMPWLARHIIKATHGESF